MPLKFEFEFDFDKTLAEMNFNSTKNNIINQIKNICKRDPREGRVTTGGIVTVKDTTDNWYLSWTINRQPQFQAAQFRHYASPPACTSPSSAASCH